jgi:hypothetical protein
MGGFAVNPDDFLLRSQMLVPLMFVLLAPTFIMSSVPTLVTDPVIL